MVCYFKDAMKVFIITFIVLLLCWLALAQPPMPSLPQPGEFSLGPIPQLTTGTNATTDTNSFPPGGWAAWRILHPPPTNIIPPVVTLQSESNPSVRYHWFEVTHDGKHWSGFPPIAEGANTVNVSPTNDPTIPMRFYRCVCRNTLPFTPGYWTNLIPNLTTNLEGLWPTN